MITDPLRYVRKLLRAIDEKRASSQEHLCSGMYQDLVKYREEIGFLRGLESARASVVELLDTDERTEIGSS